MPGTTHAEGAGHSRKNFPPTAQGSFGQAFDCGGMPQCAPGNRTLLIDSISVNTERMFWRNPFPGATRTTRHLLFCGVHAVWRCGGTAKNLRHRSRVIVSHYSPGDSSNGSLESRPSRSDVSAHEKVAGQRESVFVCMVATKLRRREKVCARKQLHDDDILIYNRAVPDFERMRLNPIAATNITLIGGDKHGSQEKKGR